MLSIGRGLFVSCMDIDRCNNGHPESFLNLVLYLDLDRKWEWQNENSGEA